MIADEVNWRDEEYSDFRWLWYILCPEATIDCTLCPEATKWEPVEYAEIRINWYVIHITSISCFCDWFCVFVCCLYVLFFWFLVFVFVTAMYGNVWNGPLEQYIHDCHCVSSSYEVRVRTSLIVCLMGWYGHMIS